MSTVLPGPWPQAQSAEQPRSPLRAGSTQAQSVPMAAKGGGGSFQTMDPTAAPPPLLKTSPSTHLLLRPRGPWLPASHLSLELPSHPLPFWVLQPHWLPFLWAPYLLQAALLLTALQSFLPGGNPCPKAVLSSYRPGSPPTQGPSLPSLVASLVFPFGLSPQGCKGDRHLNLVTCTLSYLSVWPRVGVKVRFSRQLSDWIHERWKKLISQWQQTAKPPFLTLWGAMPWQGGEKSQADTHIPDHRLV